MRKLVYFKVDSEIQALRKFLAPFNLVFHNFWKILDHLLLGNGYFV